MKIKFFLYLFTSIIFISIFFYFSKTELKTDTFQANFPKTTSAIMKKYNELYFFNHCTNVHEDQYCLNILNQKNQNKKVVWIGNSQLDMINNKKTNEITAAELIYPEMINKNVDFVAFSHPNISLKEKYFLLNYIIYLGSLLKLQIKLIMDFHILTTIQYIYQMIFLKIII